MLELERRAAVRRGGEAQPHLVDRPVAVDPREVQRARRIARDDLPAGVAREAEAAARAEVAADREEPPVQALRLRARAPDVLDRRVVRAPQDRGAGVAGA